MTSTAANNNNPVMVQTSAFQSVARNQQNSLESGNAGVFQSSNIAAAAAANEDLLSLSMIPTNVRPQTNTDLVQQEQTTATAPNSRSKIVRVLRDDDSRRCESPTVAADCQKIIPNSSSSSATNFRPDAVSAPTPPPDCLARLEAPDCLYFVCKKRVVIGRETAHSTADVSFKKTFVSRAHLELTFVASSSSTTATAKNDDDDDDEAMAAEDDEETTSDRDEGVWLLKCNGKNGILINNVQFNKDEAERVLPAECILRFPSTDIQLHFWYSNNCRNLSQQQRRLLQQQQQQQQQSQLVSPETTPAAEFDQNGGCGGAAAVNCSSSSTASSLQTCSVHPEDPACTSSKLQDDDSRFKNCDDLDSSIEKCNDRTPSLDYDFEQADADESSDCDGFSAADDKDGKPPYSYAQLIVQAIASTEDKQMTLAGIYAYITKHYAYYRTCDKGWQNSIRHNLSLCRHFVRVPRSQDEPGKGSFWRIDPSCETKQIQTAYKKRRQGKTSICLASSSSTTATTTSTTTTTVFSTTNPNSAAFSGATTAAAQMDATPVANSVRYVNGYGMSECSSKTSSPVAWSANETTKLQDMLSPASIDPYTRTFQPIDSISHPQNSSIQRHSSSSDSFYSNQSSSLSSTFQRRSQEEDGVALDSPSSSSTMTTIDRWNPKIGHQQTALRHNFTTNNNNKTDAVYCNGKISNANDEEAVIARKNASTVIEFAGDTIPKENENAARKNTPPPCAQNATTTIFTNEPPPPPPPQFSLPAAAAAQQRQTSTPFYDERAASAAAAAAFPNLIAGDVPSSRGDTICCVVNNRTASLKLPLAPKNEVGAAATASVHFKDDHLTHEYEPSEYVGASASAANDNFRDEKNENFSKTSNQKNAVALSISPHLKNHFTDQENKFANSRYLSKSAPASPKAYSKKAASSTYQSTEKDLGRGGGTFSVRRNASDGRQRLQICHSPPFHVPVESTETSALRALMQDSHAARSRRNSGQVPAASSSSSTIRPATMGGVLSSVPSTLTAAANRIGSKSLSTTPTRELLAGTSSNRYEYAVPKTTVVNNQCAPPPSNAGPAKRSTLDQLSAKQKALRFSHQRHSIDGGPAKTLPQPQAATSYVGGGAAAYQQSVAANNVFLQAGNTAKLQQALQHRSAPASPLNLLNFLPSNHHAAAAAAAVLAAGLTPPSYQQQQQQQQQTQAAQQRSPTAAAAAAAAAANLAAAAGVTNSYANLLNNPNVTAAFLNNLVVAAAANQAALMLPTLGYDVANAASAAPLLAAAAGLLPSAAPPSSCGGAANPHQSPLYAAALANNVLANWAAAAATANDQQRQPPQHSSPSPNCESPSSTTSNGNGNNAAATMAAAYLLAQRQRQAAAAPTLTLPTNLSPPAILLNGSNVVLAANENERNGGAGGGGKRAASANDLLQDFAPKMSRQH